MRQFSVLVLDDDALRLGGPGPKSVRWDELDEVKLRFYSTWRDRTSGWMQLIVRGGGSAIRVDSALRGFEDLSEAVFAEAAKRDLRFDSMTRQNAGALGLRLPEEVGRPY